MLTRKVQRVEITARFVVERVGIVLQIGDRAQFARLGVVAKVDVSKQLGVTELRRDVEGCLSPIEIVCVPHDILVQIPVRVGCIQRLDAECVGVEEPAREIGPTDSRVTIIRGGNPAHRVVAQHHGIARDGVGEKVRGLLVRRPRVKCGRKRIVRHLRYYACSQAIQRVVLHRDRVPATGKDGHNITGRIVHGAVPLPVRRDLGDAPVRAIVTP